MTPPALALALLLALAPAAAAGTVHHEAAAGQVSAAPAPRLGEYTDRLQFEIVRVAPVVAEADDHLLTVVVHATNTGADPIGELAYRFQRGTRITDQADLRAELDTPSQPVTVINSPFRDVGGVIEPGQTRTMVFSVPITGPNESSLSIARPGVYPAMINVNATVQTPAGDLRARIGEIHLTVAVDALPDSPRQTPVPAVHVLWPLASSPHRAVGEVFRTDALTREIAPGGRLDRMLDEIAGADPDLVTAVIDPMLLDELDRMSRGYRVLKNPRRPQGPLVPAAPEPGPPTSGTTAVSSAAGTTMAGTTGAAAAADVAPDATTVPGTGQQAAASFLTRLRALALVHDVIVLPYGDADISALARAGMVDELTQAVEVGRSIATQVLASPLGPPRLITTIAVPPTGVITDGAWEQLTRLGYTSLILDRRGVKPTSAGAVTVASSGGDWPALTTGAPHSAEISKVLDTATAPTGDDAIRALAAQWLITPATGDIVIVPPRDADPTRGGLQALSQFTEALSDAHLIAQRPLTALLPEPAADSEITLRYSTAARKAELDADYLESLTDLSRSLDTVGSVLQQGPGGPDPAEVLTPLAEILLPATSASLRDSTAAVDGTLTTARDTVASLIDGITIQRDTGRYTLASATAPLLLTIRNTLPYRVVVTVDIIRSSQLGLTAEAPDPITIDPGPRSADIKVDTTVTRSGTFVVDAQLYTADRVPWGPTVPLVVDSRAYGTLTIVLMASAGGILLLMVIWRLVQRLRGRVPDEALVSAEEADAEDSDAADSGAEDSAPEVPATQEAET